MYYIYYKTILKMISYQYAEAEASISTRVSTPLASRHIV